MGGLGWADDTTTHVASSAITGLVTTTVTNPADVIKTRMFVGTAGGDWELKRRSWLVSVRSR